ncbi:MAG: hypothetical protein ACYTE8_10430 [Planctomycetota bacterium]|jgi:hypothetical protein
MATRYEKMMWEKYHAILLGGTFIHSGVIPGVLLKIDFDPKDIVEGFFEIITGGMLPGSIPTLKGIDGFIWDAFGDDKKNWSSINKGGNIARDDWSHSVNIKGGASLSQYGVTFEGELSREFKGKVVPTIVQARIFEKSYFHGITQARLRDLKVSDRAVFESINNCAVVTECYYAKEFKIYIESSGSTSAEAEFKKAGIKTDVNGSGEWDNKNTLTWKDNDNVPFVGRIEML